MDKSIEPLILEAEKKIKQLDPSDPARRRLEERCAELILARKASHRRKTFDKFAEAFNALKF